MAKKKDKSETEHLRGIVKKQTKVINNLKKSVGRQKKREHLQDDLEQRLAEEMIADEQQDNSIIDTERCPDCLRNYREACNW